MTSNTVPLEVSNYFSSLGRKSGKKLLKERGPEYFSKISKMRKTHGREGSHDLNDGSYQHLANQYGVTRQRVHQIVNQKGERILDSKNFTDKIEWRIAVVKKYFSNK